MTITNLPRAAALPASAFDLQFAGTLRLQPTGPRAMTIAFSPSESAYRAATGDLPSPGAPVPRLDEIRLDEAVITS